MQLIDIVSKFKEALSDDVVSKIIRDAKSSEIKKHHISILMCSESGKLLSMGRNWLTLGSETKYSVHSEVDCVNRFYYKKTLPSCRKIMLNIRLSKKIQKVGNSKPCTHCRNFILHHKNTLNLEKVIYTTGDDLVTVISEDLESMETKLSTGDRPRD